TVPERNDDGARVIHRDDATYTFDVRAWGSVARAVAVGLPAYVRVQTNVIFDDDIGVEVPTNFAAAAPALGDPRITFSWDRNSAPLGVVIYDNGALHARLDSDDWTLNAGHYTWTDRGYADPYVTHTYLIRAVDVVGGNRKRSKVSNTVNYTPLGIEVGLGPDDRSAPIRFETKASIDSWVMVDRRATFKPLNRNIN